EPFRRLDAKRAQQHGREERPRCNGRADRACEGGDGGARCPEVFAKAAKGQTDVVGAEQAHVRLRTAGSFASRPALHYRSTSLRCTSVAPAKAMFAAMPLRDLPLPFVQDLAVRQRNRDVLPAFLVIAQRIDEHVDLVACLDRRGAPAPPREVARRIHLYAPSL